LASNTSGLSITQISEALPEALRARFCGVHFFNPPRYMHLLELIPTPHTNAEVLDQLETFATTTLGKGVVRAIDTPNFIANRVGIAGLLATMHEAAQFGLSFDVVDDLTGKKLGRASSGTFRTADVVGLDTMAHVIKTLQDQLQSDPFFKLYATPVVLQKLLDQGALGQKTGAGFYKKVGKDILQLDPASGSYVATGNKADPLIERILKKPVPERLKLLRESSNPQAQFLWAILRDGFHYAAVHLADIAHSARDVDLAMRWGFGHKEGPFELWQQAGWKTVAEWIQADIAAGKTLCAAPLPTWVLDDGRDGVHSAKGSWSPQQKRDLPVSNLAVYERQPFRETVHGSSVQNALESGTEVFQNPDVRLWTQDGEVLIASIRSKLHLIGDHVVAGLNQAVEIAEKSYKALVIWSPDDVFSAGANLQELMPVFMQKGAAGIDLPIKNLQSVFMRMRYAQVPVVAAVRGLALGGGCEMLLHCARRVAVLESYIGLVEVGVGLIPSAGGLAYIARHTAEMASAGSAKVDLLQFLSDAYMSAATAKVSTSALEAQQMGYLQPHDVIVANPHELLFVASSQAKAMFDSGYRPPLKATFPVAGRNAQATIEGQLTNLRDGGFISAYDYQLGQMIAKVVCGGDVDENTLVNEHYLLEMERRHFCSLLGNPQTQERIMGMLQTGKPVRN
jgi:3-hydroxyacyl-CoA dehydrogenase